MIYEEQRKEIKDQFTKYVSGFDISDPKIMLKIEHTFRVASLCDEISDNLNLSLDDKEISWIIGMLHDFGRFEQVRQYGTFFDSKSIDHAELGNSLLFDKNLIELFNVDQKNYDFISKAIYMHNKYRLPSDLSDRETLFCKIIRDADKIDILRVNYETPFKDIYGADKEVLENETISDEVYNAFFENKAIKHDLKRTKLDTLIGHVSLCFELEFDISKVILKKQGYIYKILEFKSNNNETCMKMKKIKSHICDFLM